MNVKRIMNCIYRAALFIGIVIPAVITAQPDNVNPRSPKQEVRAVWITTILGLDWPKTTDITEQQRSLAELIRSLKAANFNTVYFQVRGRGDAMYRSSYEPWSQQLTGTLGKDPGWDPLEFVINEAHANGIELHAWFNTFLIKNGREKPPATWQPHPILRHPDWVHLVENDWWLDPGLPEAREYLLHVAMEIVRKYDIDGFQFDFIRYPGMIFPDEASFRRYGGTQAKEDWRRENVTKLLSSFYSSVKPLKPIMKIGATTLGIYKNSVNGKGLQSYYEVYQDSRGWIEKGILDYIAPQLYWSLGEKQGNPDYAKMAAEWSQFSFGKQIVLGIGPYKPEVSSEIGEIIDVSRSVGVSGHAFFRYTNISNMLPGWKYYMHPAFTPPMAWIDSIPPGIPQKFQVIRRKDGTNRLEWQPPVRAGDGDYAVRVNIYKSASPENTIDAPENLVAIVNSSNGYFIDAPSAGSAKFFYAISSLDKGNNESAVVMEPGILSPVLAGWQEKFSPHFKIGQTILAGDRIFIPYEIGGATSVRISIMDQHDRMVANIVDDLQDPGKYVAAVATSSLRKGTYVVHMSAGTFQGRQPVQIDN